MGDSFNTKCGLQIPYKDQALSDPMLFKEAMVTIEQWVRRSHLEGCFGKGNGVAQAVFHLDGAVFTDTSDKLDLPFNSEITAVYGRLTTAGSTSSTIKLLLNGSEQTSFTIAGSATTGSSLNLAIPVIGNSDYLQAQVSAAGSGAVGLVVRALYRYTG